jgi:hypothetical protein
MKETSQKKLPDIIQYLVDKMEEKNVKIVFGLEAQDHIQTIERMISEYTSECDLKKENGDLSASSYLWDKIATEIGWCKETAMLHYISFLRDKINLFEDFGANTISGVNQALEELRKFDDLLMFRNHCGEAFCEKYKIFPGQLNFLLSVVATERIKTNDVL